MKNIIATTIIVAIIDKIWLPVKRTVLSVGDKPEYSQYQAHARTKFSNIDPRFVWRQALHHNVSREGIGWPRVPGCVLCAVACPIGCFNDDFSIGWDCSLKFPPGILYRRCRRTMLQRFSLSIQNRDPNLCHLHIIGGVHPNVTRLL